jgi:hypothetical protein
LLEAQASTFAQVTSYDFSTHGATFTLAKAALGLTTGKLYRLRLRARNLMGASGYSDTSRIGLGALPTAPAAGPTRRLDPLDASDPWSTPSSIGLEWGAVSGGALPVLAYVLYADAGLGQGPLEVHRGPLTHARLTGLTPGAVYSFSVVAENYNGLGPASPGTSLRSCVPPSGVLPPQLQSATLESATLRWAQALSSGGCETTGYKLYRDDGAEGDITTAVTFHLPGEPAQDTAEPHKFEHTVALGAAFTGTTVRFTLEALNSEGATLSQGFLSALIATVPDPPASPPSREESGRDSLTVELPAVASAASGGLTLQAYELVIDDGEAGEYRRANESCQPDLQRSHHVSNLTQGRVHRLKYRVSNALGWSAYSPVASLLVAGVPDRPGKPVVDSTSGTQIVLGFAEPASNGGSPIDAYKLYVKEQSASAFTEVTTYDGTSMTHSLDKDADSLSVG